jgi:hypothetical protein
MKALAPALALLVAVTPLRAQETAHRGPIVTVNPLGLLQFGPTLEAEFSMGRSAAFAAGARLVNAGLISHSLDSEIGFSWTAMASVRLYTNADRKPAGWYIAPRVEFGTSRSADENYTLKGGGLEAAYRWLFKGGKNLSAGGIAGKFDSQSGLSGWFVMGVLNLGIGS